ncbi:Dam family site-specific DNA-(adenine-N6)-methyltransferase [Mycoplasmopsis meleagridis]|uniref:Dam family site-specific DNA-(adenine-N6)-methyltransferase n=1 Tax=Mycoplasmopsis meleagridis TaxID=29561 RepID=UPI003A886482
MKICRFNLCSQKYKTTRQIEAEYGITRQTIHNWISTGLLKAPSKSFRNWFTWSIEDEVNLRNVIEKKYNKIDMCETYSEDEELLISNRRYLGFKQKLLDFIGEIVAKYTCGVESVADIFAGTGVVADYFKKSGKKIIVNDILTSNLVVYKTWFSDDFVDMDKIKKLIREFNLSKPSEDNYVSINFGNKYFSLDNARKIGYIREKIETVDINDREKSILLTSLIYAMDKVANTVGHYDAYRKKMDSYQPLLLKVPHLEANKNNSIYCEDANELVRKIYADLVYIDTPYNSRQYGDAYHLLENIVNWEKPEVIGVARKMVNRENIKSAYSTNLAPKAFDDLIENINAKYILVSYNNMAKKGNGRSNAKISNDEIISSLQKRGDVKIFETSFKVFTTGKTNIKNHKELLYLCTINEKKYVKSPINYSGGKYKLLKQILPLFPRKIDTFYDVFSGGANVAINIEANKVVINDIDEHIVNLLKYLDTEDIYKVIEGVEKLITRYKLSNTKKYGYSYYNVNSSIGLKSVNEKSYLQLRKDYNEGNIKDNENLVFYTLLVYAFNNQIRFNNSGLYNTPVGKRDFNLKMEQKLIDFKNTVTKRNIVFMNKDFRDLLKEIDKINDFVYLDPPYLISTATYNENGGWTELDEIDLLACLDNLNKKGIKFALSNVLEHNGRKNKLLEDWAKKYTIHYLNHNYNNSNYQFAASSSKTKEVLITNYW